MSRPRTCASFLLFRMVSRWAQWCVLLLLPRLLTLTCCSPAWTPTPRQGLRRQQGSMQMNKRLCGAEETSRSGIGVGSPSSSLRWLWKKRSNRSAAAHGKWQENSVPSDEDLNGEVGASARSDYELLQSLYEAPMPPNDETWIYSAMVGRHQGPGTATSGTPLTVIVAPLPWGPPSDIHS